MTAHLSPARPSRTRAGDLCGSSPAPASVHLGLFGAAVRLADGFDGAPRDPAFGVARFPSSSITPTPPPRAMRDLTPMNDAELHEIAEVLAEQALEVDTPAEVGRWMPLAMVRVLCWGLTRPFRMGRMKSELERYQVVVGVDSSTAVRDLAWVKWRLVKLLATDASDRKRLLHIASRRLLMAKASGADDDPIIVTTERALASVEEQRVTPKDFCTWPVEQRTNWYRERNRLYATAWRTALGEDAAPAE